MPTGHLPLALIIADLHLSYVQPAALAEPSWMVYQWSVLNSILTLQRGATIKAQAYWGDNKPIPVICAGDVFDVPQPPYKLVNMLRYFIEEAGGEFYAVPGQHDLLNHDVEALASTGYGTVEGLKDLCGLNHYYEDGQMICSYPQAEECCDTCPLEIRRGDFKVNVYGNGWDQYGYFLNREMLERSNESKLFKELTKVCILHKYIHVGKDTAHAAADGGQHAEYISDDYDGFDFVFSGDNHTPFHYQKNKKHPLIVNIGSTMQRNIGQQKYEPSVVLLCGTSSGVRAVRIKLGARQPKWTSADVLSLLEHSGAILEDFQSLITSAGPSQDIFTLLHSFLLSQKKSHLFTELRELLMKAKAQSNER